MAEESKCLVSELEKQQTYTAKEITLEGVTQQTQFFLQRSDLEVRTIRVYNRPLSDDEKQITTLLDAQSVEQMINMLDENDNFSAEGSELILQK